MLNPPGEMLLAAIRKRRGGLVGTEQKHLRPKESITRFSPACTSSQLRARGQTSYALGDREELRPLFGERSPDWTGRPPQERLHRCEFLIILRMEARLCAQPFLSRILKAIPAAPPAALATPPDCQGPSHSVSLSSCRHRVCGDRGHTSEGALCLANIGISWNCPTKNLRK
jgi:hypothetical protein